MVAELNWPAIIAGIVTVYYFILEPMGAVICALSKHVVPSAEIDFGRLLMHRKLRYLSLQRQLSPKGILIT